MNLLIPCLRIRQNQSKDLAEGWESSISLILT